MPTADIFADRYWNETGIHLVAGSRYTFSVVSGVGATIHALAVQKFGGLVRKAVCCHYFARRRAPPSQMRRHLAYLARANRRPPL